MSAPISISRGSESTPFSVNKLSDVLQLKILSLLELIDLCSVGQVCRYYNDLHKNEVLWRKLKIPETIKTKQLTALITAHGQKILFLNLSYTSQAPTVFSHITEGRLQQLKTLSVLGCDLTDEMLSDLISSEHARSLEKLYLGLNPNIRDEGVKALANSEHVTNLTDLYLQQCNVGDAGLIALTNSPYLENLETLYIGQEVGDAGVIALAESVYLPKLKHLDIHDQFGDDGLTALCNSKSLNKQLKTLQIEGAFSNIPAALVLKKFTQLEELLIRSDELSEDEINELRDSCDKKGISHDIY